MITDRQILNSLADEACRLLVASQMQEVAVPLKFCLRAAFAGDTVAIAPRAFFGPPGHPLHFGRIVRVRGGQSVQVLNVVLYPRPGSGWPIFGCEILAFSRGVHLVVLDAFDLHDSPRERGLAQLLQGYRQKLDDEFGLAPVPDWGQAVFSDQVVLVKPGAKRQASVQSFAPYFTQSLELLFAPPESGDLDGPSTTDSAVTEGALSRRRRYLIDHGNDEPAGPFLERLSSKGWVDDFVFDFLFPRWLYDGDDLPTWHRRPAPSAPSDPSRRVLS